MGHLFDGRTQATASLKTNLRTTSAYTSAASDAQGMLRYEGVPAYGVLEYAAMWLPDREAICYGDEHWTYAELDGDACRCAAMLQRLGVKPGDRVGILLPNVPEYVIAANAIWRVGGTVVAINPMMVADEVSRLMHTTDCRFVVCLDLLSYLVKDPAPALLDVAALARVRATDVVAPHVLANGSYDKSSSATNITTLLVSIREHLPALQQLGYLWKRHSHTGHWTLPTTDHCRWFWDEIKQTQSEWQPVPIDPLHDVAYILPTGGTTGSPKAVALSHQNMVANAWQQFERTKRSFGTEKLLAVLPFFHSYGMSATVMTGAMMGASLVLHHRFNVRQVIRLIEQHQPTVFHAVPAMLVAMNERLRSYPADLKSIRWVISGGAPLEAAVGLEFAKHSGAVVVEGFGLSEASPVTHAGDLFSEPRYGTIGLPLPETQCRIVDVTAGTIDVATGEVGELIIKGPQVMLSYWNDAQATTQAVRDGWLYTGDLATDDEEGYYRIVGRKKDLIITSGFNVYPSEVEAVLREHADVLDAAIVGQPDSHRGEIVKAFIVLRPGVRWDEGSLREYCDRHLSKYKRPRIYQQCIDDLPRNFLGKVIHRALRTLPVSGVK